MSMEAIQDADMHSSWRSSTSLVILTSTLGLFTETFLYGFVVPIVAYMFEVRLHQDPALTQRYISALLFLAGFTALLSAPLIGHLADKTSNRRIPLLISLAGCILGTVLVATTPSVWAVFLGRGVQGIATQGAWIICYSTLTDRVDKQHLGKAFGLTAAFAAAGVLVGPAVAGTLLEWLGYWPAWSVPFMLLAIDLILRLVMIETHPLNKPRSRQQQPEASNGVEQPNESSRLLSPSIDGKAGTDATANPKSVEPASAKGFYRTMLTNGTIVVALVNVTLLSLIVAAFDATFPLHLRKVFGWGPAPVGLIFLCIQIPAILTASMVGWLRDHVGLRKPTTLGWILTAPAVLITGIPGTWELSFLDSKTKAEAAFIGCIVVLGVVLPLARGAGTVQLTITMHELQDKHPETFGPHGGSSRTFSLSGIAFNIGLASGPVLGGALADTLGLFSMMCALAALCIIAAGLTWAFFTDMRSLPTGSEDTTQ